MKSRISIEVDFNNNNLPVIQILHSDSDDVRDKLISHFAQMLGGSSWCQIKWLDTPNRLTDDVHLPDRIHISPIHPTQFKEQAAIMLEEARLNGHLGDSSKKRIATTSELQAILYKMDYYKTTEGYIITASEGGQPYFAEQIPSFIIFESLKVTREGVLQMINEV